MSESSRLKCTIYVGGLDLRVTPEILQDAFIPFGDIVEVTLPKPDLPSNKDPHRGFGYIEFETPEDASDAIDNMDQSELFGRVLKVAAAKPQKDQNEGLGSKTALWNQESWVAKNVVQAEQDHDQGDDSPRLEDVDMAGPKEA